MACLSPLSPTALPPPTSHASSRLALVDLLSSSQQSLLPFTCIVHTLLIPWVARVALELHVPTAILWIQSVAAFDVYYYYFNGYSDVIRNGYKDDGSNSLLFNIWLPGLPLMNVLDLPSFVVSNDYHGLILKSFEEKMQVLEEEENVSILLTRLMHWNMMPLPQSGSLT
ncbi:unnamed protein product [Citrullus colocynthis]|uniref:Uncharacterized protein n=1 Tax=Citrullus colocynthis TaxID=252529 RepID=A0ABP0YDB6_9ROSI